MTDCTSSISVTLATKPHGSLSFDSKIVDEYILTEVLGQGSCAIVKLGVHKVTGEQVAVKIVRPSTMQKQKEVLRELEALRTLKNHPHIIKLHKVIRENGFVCIILELGKGGELFNNILTNGRMKESQARKLFRQVLSGIQYCHANLVIHRDLKPENIMLDENGDAKISDFGLSNFIRPNTLFGTFCGSPIYTPPEIVLHKKYNGALSDVWSLGVILFVMVTGGMPWRLENNKVQNMDALLAAHFKLPDSLGLSEGLKDLIRSMLVAESHHRASVEEIVNHPWVNEGYDCVPDVYLTAQPLVPLAEINYDHLKQLSLLGMNVPAACVAIQSEPCSPALTAYRSLISRQGKMQRVTDDMLKLGEVTETPPSPSRARARSDPSADRLKMEKTRLEEIRRESEVHAADQNKEKDRIREKIRKWKAMHKSSLDLPTKNSAIVNQANGVVYVDSSASAQPTASDKSKVDKLKNFLTYFRKHPHHTSSHSGINNTQFFAGGPVKTSSTTALKQHASPVVARR